MSKRIVYLLTVLVPLVGLLAGCGAGAEPIAAPIPTQSPAPEAAKLILATTTSTADTGLLDFLLPEFEKACNCKVEYIAVGTGQALEMGTKGDADVLLVHSRRSEDKFVADGDAKERFDVMYNDFVLVGPKEDPAKVAGMNSSVDALKAIAATEAPFASRGDKSGTNNKELSLWASAAITPTADTPWYRAIGQGMGDTLLFSEEQKAYTFSDRGTWLAMQDKLPDLAIMVGGDTLADNPDKKLLNPYGLMAVNPDKHPGVKYDLAMQFVDWMLSPDAQKMIGDFGMDQYGQPLFYPGAPPSSPAATAAPAAAALTVTGVTPEVSRAEDQLEALTAIDVSDIDRDGTTTYSGVLISNLLAATEALTDVQTCADCIVASNPAGGMRSVLPSQSGKAQVKGLVENSSSRGGPSARPA